jgi:hypothetical protein
MIYLLRPKFLREAITLSSRGYLLWQRAVAGNSRFNESVGDSQGRSGANPEFPATAKPGGISFEISPFEKAHGLAARHRKSKRDVIAMPALFRRTDKCRNTNGGI